MTRWRLALPPLLPTVIVVLAFGVVVFLVVTVSLPEVLQGRLIDPDSFTRLLRVEALMRSGAWFDSLEPRLNAPHGLESHWTRPFDVLLLLIALPLRPFVGAQDALYWAGFTISPLLALLGLVVFGWAVTPAVGRNRAPIAMAALLLQPGFVNAALPGRADHHMLLLLLFMLVLGLGFRLAKEPDDSGRMPETLGIVLALGLWVSVEFLLPVAAVALAFALFHVRWQRPWSRVGVRAFAWSSVALLAALLLERGPGMALVEYDRVSLAHLAALTVTALYFAALAVLQARGALPVATRVFVMSGLTLLAALLLVALFPGLAVDPLNQGDAEVWNRFLQRIGELRPLDPDVVGWSAVLAYVGGAALVVPTLLDRGIRGREPEARMAGMLLLVLLPFLLLGIGQIRFMSWVGVATAAGLGILVHRIEEGVDRRVARPAWRVPARAAGTALVLMAPVLVAVGVAGAERPSGEETSGGVAGEACPIDALVELLTGPPHDDDPLVLLTLPGAGPELAYRTRHRFVAAPYHRMQDGIAAYLSLSGTEGDVRTTVERRGIDAILVCPGWDGVLSTEPESFYDTLLSGRIPFWLTPVQLPPELGLFRIYRVTS